MSNALDRNWGRIRRVVAQGGRFLRGTLTAQHLGRTQVVFVVGCQRSGTSMMLNILDKSASIWTFGENHPAIAHRYRLRSTARLRMVTMAMPARWVVYKPLCDSQWTDRLLADHRTARALWMYRRPDDVARSAQVKWADHQRDVLRRIHVRDWAALRWRGERLSEDVIKTVDTHYDPDMSRASASVLYWWVRNRLFFELGLDQDARVRLVRYEPLVQDPTSSFRDVFDFLGLMFEDRFVEDVHAKSVKTDSEQDVDPSIASLANDLLMKLDACGRPKP